MLKLLALSAALFVVSISHADQEQLIDQIASQIASQETVGGTFVQHKEIAVLPMPLRSRGHYRFDDRQEIVWTVDEPVESQIRINSRGVFVGSEKQPAPGTHYFSEILLAVFMGDFSAVSTQFSVKASGDLAAWVVELSPLSELVAEKIKVITIQGDSELACVEVYEGNGDMTRIEFEDAAPSASTTSAEQRIPEQKITEPESTESALDD